MVFQSSLGQPLHPLHPSHLFIHKRRLFVESILNLKTDLKTLSMRDWQDGRARLQSEELSQSATMQPNYRSRCICMNAIIFF